MNIYLALQDVTPPSLEQISSLTEKFGFATAAAIAMIFVILAVLVFFIVNVVGTQRQLAKAVADGVTGQTVMLELMRQVVEYVNSQRGRN